MGLNLHFVGHNLI